MSTIPTTVPAVPRRGRTRTRAVVLGAGYGGQLAAQAIAARTGAEVTLVNDGDRFVERVRLHQTAAGRPVPAPRLATLLAGTGVHLVDDRAVGIDLERDHVRLRDGDPLAFDVLVLALGSHADLDSVDGVREHAHEVTGPAGAERLRERLDRAPAGTRLTVVGGGLTGIETATELAEARPGLAVTLRTAGVVGPGLSARGRAHVRRACARLGVTLAEHGPVTRVRAGGIVLADGTGEPADVVVWTTGFTVDDLARRAGLDVDASGRVRVDASLRSTSHPRVLAVGDIAVVARPPEARRAGTPTEELRMACATAMPAAQAAARTVADVLAGRTPRRLRFRFVNQCVSLGRRDGVVQFVHRDDTPRERILAGRAAAAYKEVIVRGALRVQRHPKVPTAF